MALSRVMGMSQFRLSIRIVSISSVKIWLERSFMVGGAILIAREM